LTDEAAVSSGSKVVPHAPEEEHLALNSMANAAPKEGQSSPDVVVDVGGGINTVADQLGEHVLVLNAPSPTLSPEYSPAPAESPLVGSPVADPVPATLLQAQNENGVIQVVQRRSVAIGRVHETPVAWGSSKEADEENDGSPSGKNEEAKKLSEKDKKKAKSKDKKDKSAKLKETEPAKSQAGVCAVVN
jgi:hypothetical protein